MEVRRAHSGPGLWPGPRRQARWAGRGSGVKGLPEGTRRRCALDAGGASPDNARRTGPQAVTCSWLTLHLARASRPGRGAGGRGSGIRRGPQAAGHRGCRARQSPRRRACVRRTRRELPPSNGETPRLNSGRLRRVTLAALSSRRLAPVPAVHDRGRQAWRAEGAPLMIVKKILTASVWRPSDRPRRRPGYGYSGQSNRAQIVRVVLSPSIPHSSATARTMSNPWCRVGSIIPWFQGPPLSWTSIRA